MPLAAVSLSELLSLVRTSLDSPSAHHLVKHSDIFSINSSDGFSTHTLLVGCIVGVVSAATQSLGLTLQRKSHIDNDAKPSHLRRPAHRRSLWRFGVFLFLLANVVGSSVQITTLPLIVLSPLQAVGLVFNSLCAAWVLHEPLTTQSAVGTLLVAIGAFIVAAWGVVSESAKPHNLNELLRLLERPQFLIWMAATLALISGVLMAIAYRSRPRSLSLGQWLFSHLNRFKPLRHPASLTRCRTASTSSTATSTNLTKHASTANWKLPAWLTVSSPSSPKTSFKSKFRKLKSTFSLRKKGYQGDPYYTEYPNGYAPPENTNNNWSQYDTSISATLTDSTHSHEPNAISNNVKLLSLEGPGTHDLDRNFDGPSAGPIDNLGNYEICEQIYRDSPNDYEDSDSDTRTNTTAGNINSTAYQQDENEDFDDINPKQRLINGLMYAVVCGILSAHSLLMAKSAVEILVRCFVDGKNADLYHYQSYLIVFAFLCFAVSQLVFLNRGLRLCSTAVLYPLVFCVYNVTSILNSLIYFQQTQNMSVLQAGMVSLGTLFILLGVMGLSWHLGWHDDLALEQAHVRNNDEEVVDDENLRENGYLSCSNSNEPCTCQSSSGYALAGSGCCARCDGTRNSHSQQHDDDEDLDNCPTAVVASNHTHLTLPPGTHHVITSEGIEEEPTSAATVVTTAVASNPLSTLEVLEHSFTDSNDCCNQSHSHYPHQNHNSDIGRRRPCNESSEDNISSNDPSQSDDTSPLLQNRHI